MPENRNGRPTSPKVETASVSDGDLNETSVATATDIPRCRHCGHIVWHPVSIVTGLGRDCRREIARAAREVVT